VKARKEGDEPCSDTRTKRRRRVVTKNAVNKSSTATHTGIENTG
jgi:hypothetical protein